ncbi:hypothetical protein [Dokdonella sp.]|uniref:hypothetical protein n=1 Tax=Dokdonella sp. TaxID=2291710 RepID=UPI001B24C9D1|nr:hypothetical protein [Dokdonella sp.]MBO9661444.1 hypothetical protein [Dokdonella sp.]
MHRLLCATLLASLAAVAVPQARAGNLLDLAVVDRDTGQTLPTYSKHGKLYVAGAPGHRYAVRLSNRSGGRVLAVLSVDGVNAVSGETASPEQSGYVLDPWETTEIAGWRKSLEEVAQFNFTALPDSYAARTGRPANVGVIGVAVFTERTPVWREKREEIARESESAAGAAADAQNAPAPAAAEAKAAAPAEAPKLQASQRALAKGERLGTGHGAREYARVDTTTFVRASRGPAETVAVWYDSYANLVAQGIAPRPIARRTEPQPFPGGFVPDPAPR